MKKIRDISILALSITALLSACNNTEPMNSKDMSAEIDTQEIVINGVKFDVDSKYDFFGWDALPGDLDYIREEIREFENTDGNTNYYEVVYLPDGNLNWYQAAYLAEDAGGYLTSINSQEENDFIFSLVSDDKYFWKFPPHDGDSSKMNHHEISIGPFLGGYQPVGSPEPDGGWQWLSGEVWDYTNWSVDLGDGDIDRDPRDNTQPNDSGGSGFGQRVMGFGEFNEPVATWGDYMDDVGTYGIERLPGRSYAFIIEYEEKPE